MQRLTPDPVQFIEWLRFLHDLDEDGIFRGTVSGVLDAWQAAQ